jgi:hypothetical protein
MSARWALVWPYGRLFVYAKGGMLGGVKLRVGDRWLSPFYEPPWLDAGEALEPTLLQHMRSEFPCVPFGGVHAPETVVPEW